MSISLVLTELCNALTRGGIARALETSAVLKMQRTVNRKPQDNIETGIKRQTFFFFSETFFVVFLYKGHRRVASVFYQTSVHRNRRSNFAAQGYPAYVQLESTVSLPGPFSMVMTASLSPSRA